MEFEGTPEELDASDLARKLLSTIGGTAGGGVDATPSARKWRLGDPVPGVEEEGQAELTGLLAQNPAAALFVEFLAEACSWENVRAYGVKRQHLKPGEPLDYSDYLRLRKVGSQLGGFAYVRADLGRVNVRLSYGGPEEHLLKEAAPRAYAVHTGHRAYRVSINIEDDESLRQAIALARLAYDRT
ncbi:hypothetical protein ACFY00_12850 [Kitasatospora sp. NPDC001540]|uniref:hypothetical protein n=1 Tax=Kitasatospora sp. NPDC001540 TaxID=3364014 RepID=UPI0036818E28